MCDYCDCRSHPAIASLSADHEVILGLLDRLRRAAEVGARTSSLPLLAQLQDVLGSHAAREEGGVFTQLRRAEVDATYIEGFEEDHDRIHALLEGCGGDGWEHAVRELTQVLARHIASEESDLFPAAHQLLTPGQWDEVDAVHSGALTHERGSLT